MNGLLGNSLPPGLAGFVAQRQLAGQENMQNMAQLQGLLGAQNAMFEQQLNPLKLEQLKVQLADAKRKSELVNGLLGGAAGGSGGGSTPVQMVNGKPMEGGMSVPGQAPRQGGLLGAVNDPQMVMALKLAGIGDFTEMYKFFNTPQKQEGGAFYVDPLTQQRKFIPKVGEGMSFGEGGTVTDTPGYLPTLGKIEGAKEGAKAEFDFVPYPIQKPDGSFETLMIPRAQAVRMSNGGQGQQPQMPNASGSPQPGAMSFPSAPTGGALPGMVGAAGFPSITPQVQADRDRIASGIRQREVTGGGIPTASIVGRPGVVQSESEKAANKVTAEGRAKSALERETNFQNSWGESYARLQQLDLIQNLMSDPNVASGTLAETVSSLKGVADSLGIAVKGKTAEDVIAAVTNEMALKMRLQGGQNLMPGAMSNFETKLLTSMSPSMSQSREGRMLLIQVSKAKAEKDMKISEMAADYLDKNGKLDSGFDRQVREYSRANPMFTNERMSAMTELARRLNGGAK